MESGYLELIIIFALILLNGFFSMSEAAMISSRIPRLRHEAEQGRKRYKAALDIAENPGPFLSAIQIGITLIGTIAGAFGGATLALTISETVRGVPSLAPYANPIGIALVVILITFLSVVFGELVPKRIALSRPEHIAATVVTPMRTFQLLFLPLVKILGFSTDLVLKIFGLHRTAEPSVTEEEVRIMIREGARHGVFERREQEMVEAVFYLGERRAETFMTPRREIVWIELDASVENIKRIITINSTFYFFPVCDDGLDNVIGIVDVRTVLITLLEGTFTDIRTHMQKPVFIPENLHALKVLETFRVYSTQVVFLVDEYGGIQGMLSMQDIMEELVGELPGTLNEEQEIVKRTDGTFLVDGSINIDDFAEYFHLERSMPEEPEYHTLAGFILDRLGVIPSTGDKLDWNKFTFEIIDMDGIRIDKVLLTVREHPDDGDTTDREVFEERPDDRSSERGE